MNDEIIGIEDERELNVTIETKVRTALFFVVWLNQIFAFVGLPTLNLDFESTYAVVSAIVTFGVSAWAWWKNNSFTKPALLGDEVMRAARHAKDE